MNQATYILLYGSIVEVPLGSTDRTDQTGGEGLSDPRPAFADRLNELFATIGHRDENGTWREFSTPYVARTISEDPAHDTSMSRVYLATLRSGSNTNPTIAVVRAIAAFFDQHRAPHDAPVTAATCSARIRRRSSGAAAWPTTRSARSRCGPGR